METLKIFVGSPNDVFKERGHVSALADELNRGIARDNGFYLEVFRWETHAIPDIGRAQQLLFDQVGKVDIFIGIMWQHFGTPTGIKESGTEEEFESALATWQQHKSPRILFYFSQASIRPPATIDGAEQLLKVVNFRQRVEQTGLACTYENDSEFKDRLREHLQHILVNDFAKRRPPLDPNLLALLNVEKQRCRDRNVAYFSSNLLFSILSPKNGLIRQIFASVCSGKTEAIVENLRSFTPRDAIESVISFSEFDWYDRKEIQAARRWAKQDLKSVIDVRHLLLGFLDIDSQTKSSLYESLGNEAFERLRIAAQTTKNSTGTPGIRQVFSNLTVSSDEP